MTLEDPRPGDRFRVTFEGTYRPAPGRLHVGESAGLPWGFMEHAVSVERIGPELVPGALYVDADGRGWEASRMHLHPVPESSAGLVRFDQAHTLPGLRRARLVAEDDAGDDIGVVQWPELFVKSQVAAWQSRDATERCTSGNPRLGTVCTLMRGHDGVHFHAPILPPLPSQDSSCGCA